MSLFVTLTAGHSNRDPGAVNGTDREADIAQDMRNIVASILRNEYKIQVKTDGEGKLYEDRLKAVARERFSDKDLLLIETKLIEPKTYLITLRYVVLAK